MEKCTIKLASKNKERFLLLNSYSKYRRDYFNGVAMLKQGLYTRVRMECSNSRKFFSTLKVVSQIVQE